MNCDKQCECKQCENLEINYPITFVERRGLNEHRETLVGFHCTRYGQCSDQLKKLKTSDILDDIIFIN